MPAITRENAAELGRNGALARKQRRIAELAMLERARIIEQGALAAAAVSALNPAPADASPVQSDNYVKERLARVRKQLDRIDTMLMTEGDPQRMDRLAAAQARLAEQERQLAGRPSPGSLRPTSKRSPAGPSSDPEPEPA